MLYCFKEPIKKLNEVLEKLDGTHEDCHPYDYTECDYLHSQVKDREKFKACVKEAIQKLEEANSHTDRISSTYPHYTPLKELEWVSKEVFMDKKGKELESDNASFDLIVTRYENGEEHLFKDGVKYGLYL